MTIVDDYLAAIAEWEAAKDALAQIAYQLENFGRNLKSRADETCFAPFDGEEQPPLDEMMPGKRWNAEVFPTPALIQAAARRRLLARQHVWEIWGLIPEDKKRALREPKL